MFFQQGNEVIYSYIYPSLLGVELNVTQSSLNSTCISGLYIVIPPPKENSPVAGVYVTF